MIEWKQIPMAPDYYISNRGEVLSKRVEGKELIVAQHVNQRTGYLQCTIAVEDKPSKVRKTFYPHRLVAQAFIPNPNGYDRVNHKDLDKSNSHVHNLEWCSQTQNIHHYYRSNAINKPREMRSIEVWDRKGNYVATYPSLNQAAKAHDYNPTTVFNQLKRGVKNPRRFEFRYAD